MGLRWCHLAVGLIWAVVFVSGHDDIENRVIICEGDSMSLQCPEGKYIQVKSATYGRTDKTTCPHIQVDNTNCKGNNSLHIVAERCEKKKECYLEASNAWFGDPCLNTYKYLIVEFQCIKDIIEKVFDICEGTSKSLHCPDGRYIQVKSATYGRTDKTTCPHSQVHNTNCKDDKSLQIVSERCTNKTECFLEASNGWYGDPCLNTYKYLRVEIMCIKDAVELPGSVVICEGATKSLHCPDGEHIHVTSAAYGRADKTTCPHNQVDDTNCKGSSSLHTVTEKCENKKECYLEANNGWFGDPCINTYKYLRVEFVCIKDNIEKVESVIICEGATRSLHCPDGKYIQVKSATYGRTDKTTCPHNQVYDTNCRDKNSSLIIAKRCENKKECHLEANNGWFGDPCINTYKYLRVEFECIKDTTENVESVIICEGATRTLHCPDGKYIQVKSATYGRTDKTTCPHNQVYDTNCRDNKSSLIIAERCGNRKECYLEASNAWFGDPCQNTYKYLRVDFECSKGDF